MALTQAHITDLYKACEPEALTYTQATKKFKFGYMELVNFLKTAKGKLLFFVEKHGGFAWIRSNPLFFIEDSLDLICSKQKAVETKKHTGRRHKNLENLKQVCPEKFEALLIANRCQGFGYIDKATKEFIDTNGIKAELQKFYEEYLTRILHSKIVICRAPDGSPMFAHDIEITYQTRFTSKKRQQDNIKAYDTAWEIASSNHLEGFFLTLTAPSKGYDSLAECNFEMKKIWGDMRDFLKRNLPSKCDFIKVSEFQKNGRLHFHVIVFGKNWIMHKSVLQYKWVQLGGGYVMYIHTIRQNNRGWYWSGGCPSDAAGQNPQTYLSQYLKKSMTKEDGLLYWLFNVNFWSCSKGLRIPKEKTAPKGYILKGVRTPSGNLKPSKRKDTIAFFKGELKRTCNKLKPKPKPKPEKKEKLDMGFRRACELTYNP